MSWNAQIARTERNSDRLDIIIHYSDGTNEYDQTISTTTNQADSWLSDQISSKLNQLTNLDTFQQAVEAGDLVSANLVIDPDLGQIVSTPILVAEERI